MPVETSNPPLAPPPEPIPPLRDGDRMTWDEFERRWDAMPEVKKAELLEGVVYMPPPPVSDEHGIPHFDLIGWLAMYRFATPGVVGADNATVRLDMANAPQPDALLRILASHGGHARIDAQRVHSRRAGTGCGGCRQFHSHRSERETADLPAARGA